MVRADALTIAFIQLIPGTGLWSRNGSALLIQHGPSNGDHRSGAWRLALEATRQFHRSIVIIFSQQTENSFDIEIWFLHVVCRREALGLENDVQVAIFTRKNFRRVGGLYRLEHRIPRP